MNLYESLGVKSDCSPDTLRRKYHRLLLEHHPDKTNTNDSMTRKRFEEIQSAYRILSNVELRLKYDQEQERRHLHARPHANIHSNDLEDDEYNCRCGTILLIDQERDFDVIECPNCSMKIQLRNK